jgi:WD40 repeat protein
VQLDDATFRADASRLLEQLNELVEGRAGGGVVSSAAWRGTLRLASHAEFAVDTASPVLSTGTTYQADGRALALLAGRTVRVLSAPGLQERRSVTDKRDIGAVGLSPDGQTVATASAFGIDEGVTLWDVRSGRRTGAVARRMTVRGVAFSGDGARLATANSDKTARIWNLSSGRDEAVLAHGDHVTTVQWSRDGTVLATSGHDRAVCVWDVGSGQRIARSEYDGDGYHVTALRPDGRSFAIAGGDWRDGTTRLWDVATGRPSLEIDTGVRSALSFAPDGRLVAAGSYKDLGLWDTASGERLATTPEEDLSQGNPWICNAIAFSPDGRTLALLSTRSPRRHSGVARLRRGDPGRVRIQLWAPDPRAGGG